MKLSDLMRQLEKAIAKYGDIEIGALGAYDANDINGIASPHKIICLRIINSTCLRIINSTNTVLPGTPIEEEELGEDAYAILFYDDIGS